MNQGNARPREWNEAQRRAETYLRARQGALGSAERHLLEQATKSARAQQREAPAAHPVTLVMESLFALLPPAEAVAMTPPIRRVSMLPEETEFPLHDGLRTLFRTGFSPFAGAR